MSRVKHIKRSRPCVHPRVCMRSRSCNIKRTFHAPSWTSEIRHLSHRSDAIFRWTLVLIPVTFHLSRGKLSREALFHCMKTPRKIKLRWRRTLRRTAMRTPTSAESASGWLNETHQTLITFQSEMLYKNAIYGLSMK